MERNIEQDLKNMELLIFNHIYVKNETVFFDKENIGNLLETSHLSDDVYLINKCNKLSILMSENLHNPIFFDTELEDIFISL